MHSFSELPYACLLCFPVIRYSQRRVPNWCAAFHSWSNYRQGCWTRDEQQQCQLGLYHCRKNAWRKQETFCSSLQQRQARLPDGSCRTQQDLLRLHEWRWIQNFHPQWLQQLTCSLAPLDGRPANHWDVLCRLKRQDLLACQRNVNSNKLPKWPQLKLRPLSVLRS